MALLLQRLMRGMIPWLDPDRPPAAQEPERVVLGVRQGLRPSPLPPVRIFLGTERRQFRAERVFLWSVEKHRDPSRIYEIFLMRDLARFRRRLWLTGFTNYRFTIPAFCSFSGRAIYNDADQVYLSDPAELFDTPLGQAGFLSLSDRDTSVMLLDCERMAEAWNAGDVERLGRKQLEARARHVGLWGALDPAWNARDAEYQPGVSRLVHFTTLHTQPWQPFPEQFVYFENPTDPLWQDLEREADQAGFLPVAASRPSGDWPRALRTLSARPDGAMLARLLAPEPPTMRIPELRLRGVLERVPDNDLPWVLDRLFAHTDHLLVEIDEPRAQRDGRYRRSAIFWQQQFQASEARHPHTAWTLCRRSLLRRQHWRGGPAPAGEILVLTHRKPGHDHQALALAHEMSRQSGRPVRRQCVPWSELMEFLVRPRPRNWIRGAAVIVASGWLPCRVARRLAQSSRDEPRLVLLGRKSGPPPEHGGVAVHCRHFGLPPHRNRLTTLLPLNAGCAVDVPDAGPWAEWVAAPRRVALLVGGDSRAHRLTAADATRLARAASKWASELCAALLVVGSRRSARVQSPLRAGLDEEDFLFCWGADERPNPYALALAYADILLVTGESESMLSDAVASPAKVLIWPLRRRHRQRQRLWNWVARRARQPRRNRRGSIRPQQGLSYLAARLLASGLVLPPRDLDGLHEALSAGGLAAPFGESVPAGVAFSELKGLAGRILQHIGAGQTPRPGAGELAEVAHGQHG